MHEATQRAEMVAQQLRDRGIRDPRVLAAMQRVPRHEFVPKVGRRNAYADAPIVIGGGQTISQPYMVAVMTELLDLSPTDRVLEIGTGSGYQAAILSLLAREVITIERIPELAERARAVLSRLGYDNVEVLLADGTVGSPERGPYDAIVVTAGAPQIPQSLLDQLTHGGRLVCPVGSRKTQQLVRWTRENGKFRAEEGVPCVFVPLIGEEGWRSPD